MKPLAQDHRGLRNIQGFVKLSPGRSLYAMIRPKYLRTVRSGNHVIWLLSRMRRGERKMVAGVPVLGKHDVCEARGQPIDGGYHIVTTWHRKTTSGTKIILDVDHDQYVGVACYHLSAHL